MPTKNASSREGPIRAALVASETKRRTADKPPLKRFESLLHGVIDARYEASRRAMGLGRIVIPALETTLRQNAGRLDRARPLGMHRVPTWR
jgi:hypothetical protein